VLNAEIAALKMALAAAKRPAPVSREDTFRHATRLAELEREAARVPKLIKELEALRAQPTAPTKRSAKPQPLPQQVYQLMSSTFGKRIAPDDLQLVEGIGPKIAEHLARHGLKTWADIATAKPAQLRKVLDAGGDRFQLHDPAHWPTQCKLMVENRWDELRKYQRKLSSAR
jgi:predicted flap endonuclease-1-like 5' DNA nuclease